MSTPLLPLSTRATRSPRLTLDSYLTDGVRLLRVVESGRGACTSLEDCYTLEIHPYSPGELARLRLRPVSRATLS